MTAARSEARPDGAGVLRYELTPEDALAWERRSPKIRRRDRVALAAGLFAGIGLVQVIGAHLPGVRMLHTIPMAVALMALPVLAVLWMQARDHRKRAMARISAPVGVVLEHSPDRVVERRADRREAVAFGAAGLHEIIEVPGHAFLLAGSDVVILPDRAFADAAARAEFLRHWRERMG